MFKIDFFSTTVGLANFDSVCGRVRTRFPVANPVERSAGFLL